MYTFQLTAQHSIPRRSNEPLTTPRTTTTRKRKKKELSWRVRRIRKEKDAQVRIIKYEKKKKKKSQWGSREIDSSQWQVACRGNSTASLRFVAFPPPSPLTFLRDEAELTLLKKDFYVRSKVRDRLSISWRS